MFLVFQHKHLNLLKSRYSNRRSTMTEDLKWRYEDMNLIVSDSISESVTDGRTPADASVLRWWMSRVQTLSSWSLTRPLTASITALRHWSEGGAVLYQSETTNHTPLNGQGGFWLIWLLCSPWWGQTCGVCSGSSSVRLFGKWESFIILHIKAMEVQ